MSETVVKVEGLYKKFTASLKRSMLYGTYDALRDMAGISYDTSLLRKKEFWALRDINFEVKKGEKIGFLGVNGSGKTTLLRLLNGIFPPDSGKITIKGKIGALIAVGVGFHPQMSGRENIFLNGTILGMSRREIDRNFDEIVEFAEIGEFLDAPVATYSSGMVVRLGFSIAVHGSVDIMLIDEILAVGDLPFQLKCQKKLSHFRQQGGTFIIVSHNMQAIRNTCERALWIEKGSIIADGEMAKICNDYENYSLERRIYEIDHVNKGVFNYDESVRLSVRLLNKDNLECDRICCGETIKILINIRTKRILKKPILTVTAIGDDGNVSFENYSDNTINSIEGTGAIEFIIKKLAIKPQLYYITITLSEGELLNKIEWHNNVYPLLVLNNNSLKINQGTSFFYPEWLLKI